MLRHNKFLRKVAFDKLNDAERKLVGAELLPGVFSNSNPLTIMLNRHRNAALTGINGVINARNNLHRYNAGLWGSQAGDAREYDPHNDVVTLSNFVNNKRFRNNYNKVRTKWLADPDGSYRKRIAQQIDQIIGMGDALGYAATNKTDFNKFNSFRGMGIWDYLFDSADNNYKLLQMANGPMGRFMSPEQAKHIRNNYGLMKGIWRVKKFFSDFGNWKPVDDPEVAARSQQPVDYTKLAKPYWSSPFDNPAQGGKPAIKSDKDIPKVEDTENGKTVLTDDYKNKLAQEGLSK